METSRLSSIVGDLGLRFVLSISSSDGAYPRNRAFLSSEAPLYSIRRQVLEVGQLPGLA